MMGGPAGNSGSGNKAAPDAAAGAMYVPVDVAEEADAYTFTADLPGVSRADTKARCRPFDRCKSVICAVCLGRNLNGCGRARLVPLTQSCTSCIVCVVSYAETQDATGC